jgi:hypothetical protein
MTSNNDTPASESTAQKQPHQIYDDLMQAVFNQSALLKLAQRTGDDFERAREALLNGIENLNNEIRELSFDLQKYVAVQS